MVQNRIENRYQIRGFVQLYSGDLADSRSFVSLGTFVCSRVFRRCERLRQLNHGTHGTHGRHGKSRDGVRPRSPQAVDTLMICLGISSGSGLEPHPDTFL